MAQRIEADVIQKIATPAEWATLLDTKIPYKGQIMLVSDNTGKVTNIKVGDGTNNFDDLEYMFDTIQANVNYVQVTSAALPTPTITSGFSVVGEGTYTKSGQADVVVPTGNLGILNWDGTTWSLGSSVPLPTPPVKNEYGTSTTDAMSQNKVTELKDSVDPTFEEISNSNNLLNPLFLMPNTVVGSTGSVVTNATSYLNAITIKFPVSDRIGVPFTISGYTPDAGKYVVFKDADNATVGVISNLNSTYRFFTPPTGAVFCYLYVRLNTDSSPLPDIMINDGSSPLPYEPYEDPTELIKEIGGNAIAATTLLDGSKISASNNPLGPVNRTEMEEYVAEHGGSGEAYDQSLNTTDSVKFAEVESGQIVTSVLVANLPSGSTQPVGVDPNEVWIDTANGNVLKVGV